MLRREVVLRHFVAQLQAGVRCEQAAVASCSNKYDVSRSLHSFSTDPLILRGFVSPTNSSWINEAEEQR